MNTTMEMLTYVKSLTELTDKQKSELIMNLINESKNVKQTVITKTVETPAKGNQTFVERMAAAKAAKAAAKAAKAAPAKAAKAAPAKAAKAAAKAAKAAPAKAAKAAKAAPADVNKITIVKYSDKAYAIIGETKPFKDILKGLNCRFNGFLTVNDVKEAGWIFSAKRLEDITTALKGVKIKK